MSNNIENLINEVNENVIKWRRHLHMHPELSFEEEKTSQFIYDKLLSFGNLEVERPTKTSVIAKLVGKEKGKTLGLRADMDALPIHEETDLSFKSKVDGKMHACGHDGHTAMLLGAAQILSQNKENIKGEINFIFQHAEEMLPGGAQEMVKAGVIDDVDFVVALHLMSTMPEGKIGITYGPMTSNTDMFDLRISGKGGHASQPENSVDPIAISGQIITNLQHIVSRNLAPSDQAVVSITMLNAGTANNIIPEYVDIGASVRSYSSEVRKKVHQLIERIVKGITEAHNASYELDYTYGYSSVVNDEKLTKLVEDTVIKEFGIEAVEYSDPIMGGEDFSAFSEKVPGCFVQVGAGNKEKGFDYPHHHPNFGIDEDSLKKGLRILTSFSQDFLS